MANRAKEIFKSSETIEKREIINLIFTNLKLDVEKLVFTYAKPFDAIAKMEYRPSWRTERDSNPR